jgi:hypothetical protein
MRSGQEKHATFLQLGFLAISGPVFLFCHDAVAAVPRITIDVRFFCWPGGWVPWKLVILPDGNSILEYEEFKDGKTIKRKIVKKLNVREHKAIKDVIVKSNFQSLKSHYFNSRERHRPSVEISVTQGKKTHKVYVYDPGPGENDNKEVDRFNRVWVEILGKILSPNEEQSPAKYKD